jgi:hypothetical protein
MDTIDEQTIRRLIDYDDGAAVSIYMPTHRAGAETRENPIRFRNLIDEAQRRLESQSIPAAEIKKQFAPAYDLTDDTPFWQFQADGLALFLGTNEHHVFHLPFSFDEMVMVSGRFHIKPLLILMDQENEFYILALSENSVRLFQATPNGISAVHTPELPSSAAEALKYDDPEKQQQFHTTAKLGVQVGGRDPGGLAYHGHGVASDDKNRDLERFLQRVSAGLEKTLGKAHNPLLLACVDEMKVAFDRIHGQDNVVDDHMSGNFDHLSPRQLWQEAWPFLAPNVQKNRESAKERYEQAAGNNRATSDLRDVIARSMEGAVQELLVAIGEHRWGSYDPQSMEVELREEPEAGDQDLLDVAAAYTLVNGGTVHAFNVEELPENAPVAATLRY